MSLTTLLSKVHESANHQVQFIVNDLLVSTWSKEHDRPSRWILLRILQALETVG